MVSSEQRSRRAIEQEEETQMNARTVAAAALAAVALAAPTTAVARVIPAKHSVHPAKRVAKHAATPRVALCICITGIAVQPAESEAQLEAQVDQDMVAHGLDAVYATSMTSSDTDTSTTE
jgi:hypothetical protein